MVKPAEKRIAVVHVITRYGISRTRACGLVKLKRSSYYYKAQPRDDEKLRRALKEAAFKHRRWGYRLLMMVLKREGFEDNHKRVYRIYREECLQVKQRKKKRISKWRGEKPEQPAEINSRWSMDFIHDSTAVGQKIRMLNILDDYTRRCLRIEVDTSLSGERVTRVLDQLLELHGSPKLILMDNGPEFTGRKLDEWAYRNNIRLQFIQPGKPTQNGYIESFNGTFRNECLNEHWFANLKEAKQIIENWRINYNKYRPHSSLNYLTPEEFAGNLEDFIPPRGDNWKDNTKHNYSEILTS